MGVVSGIPWSQCPIWHHVFRSKCRCNSNCSLSVRIGSEEWNQGQAYPIRISECISLPTHVVLGSIVVSISDCHSGDRGSIPRRGGGSFSRFIVTCTFNFGSTYFLSLSFPFSFTLSVGADSTLSYDAFSRHLPKANQKHWHPSNQLMADACNSHK